MIKVAHRGSAYQSRELLAALHPRVPVISLGAQNDHGHPARPTLRALRRLGALAGVPAGRLRSQGSSGAGRLQGGIDRSPAEFGAGASCVDDAFPRVG